MCTHAHAHPSSNGKLPSAKERANARTYTSIRSKRVTYTHACSDAQRRQRKSPSDQQCGNSERLRATLCESRTTRAATNDLLISLSLRARSPPSTNFPERRNRTVGELSPDVLQIGLTLPPFPAILPVVRCRDRALPLARSLLTLSTISRYDQRLFC